MARETIGFIGLGSMGKPMASHIAQAGFDMVVYDAAGTEERAPTGATCATSVADVARQAAAIFLSLPTVEAGDVVVDEIAGSGASGDLIVVNASTVGPEVSLAQHERLAAGGIAYVDAPISGGVVRARAGTLAIIFSGSAAAFARLEPVFQTMAERVFNVGETTGHGQRMKLLNNHLGITAFVATTEALAYGAAAGLDIESMLNVINASSGQSFASSVIYPNYFTPEDYKSGATAAIINKDLSLFVKSAEANGCAHHVARAALDVVEAFGADDPGVDRMHLYNFLRDRK